MVVVVLGVPAASSAQSQTDTLAPTSSDPPIVEATISNLTRFETWRFFDPPDPDVDPDYTFVGNRTHVGLRARSHHVDVAGGFGYVRLWNLPEHAIGPGGLGTGAFYFAASGVPYSYQVFLNELTLAAHTRDRRLTVTVGRMTHTSGAEGAEGDVSSDTPLARLRQSRLDGRLLGGFDWSYYQRRFDGLKVEAGSPSWYAEGVVFAPTQGGFEESANLTMPRLVVGSGVAGWRHGGPGAGARGAWGESQLFAHFYRDRRRVEVRPDNVATAVEAADVTVAALGASHLGVRPTASGRLDWLLWAAVQTGDWYGQGHRAWSVALEGGHQWSGVNGKPSLGGGFDYASGDDDARDDRHGTFFPVLPDTRTYARSFVYAQMNLRDIFARMTLDPHRVVRLRADVHRLDLAEAADRWYQGSGATASDGRFFGFSGRPAGGQRGLGTVLEGGADVSITRYWSVAGYAGRMWGGGVVRGLFAGDRLTYWYVENVLRFGLRTRD